MEQQSKRAAGVRGISWRDHEIRDLLEIWGDEKVQSALRTSQRNIDNFRKIAAQMATRGHDRTAEECRSKTKTLRLEYRRVLAHNGQSGNSPATCPYYEELDRILKGDGSVTSNRVIRSIRFAPSTERQAGPAPGSEELFSHEFTTVNMSDIRDNANTFEEVDRSTVTQETLEDSDETQIDNIEQQTGLSGGRTQDSSPERETAVRATEAVIPNPPSPRTRIDKAKEDKKKPSQALRIAKSMMEHSEHLMQMELEHRTREFEEAQRRMLEVQRQRDQKRDERTRDILQSMERTQNILQAAVEAMTAIASQPRPALRVVRRRATETGTGSQEALPSTSQAESAVEGRSVDGGGVARKVRRVPRPKKPYSP